MYDTWWIDYPHLLGSRNPAPPDLEQLRCDDFEVLISLLKEDEQSPRYDVARAVRLRFRKIYRQLGIPDAKSTSLTVSLNTHFHVSRILETWKSRQERGRTRFWPSKYHEHGLFLSLSPRLLVSKPISNPLLFTPHPSRAKLLSLHAFRLTPKICLSDPGYLARIRGKF
jgi:hypothetical protein